LNLFIHHLKFLFTMKKLFLGLLATVMFVCSGNAQNGSYSKSVMTVVVASAKGTFVKGMSYKSWLSSQIGESVIPSREEDKFLSDVYGFISTGANADTVLRNYDGKSFQELVSLSGKGGLKAIHSGNVTSDRGWCIPCLIKLLTDLACEYIVNCNGPIVNP
jgi:hypothetical protein